MASASTVCFTLCWFFLFVCKPKAAWKPREVIETRVVFFFHKFQDNKMLANRIGEQTTANFPSTPAAKDLLVWFDPLPSRKDEFLSLVQWDRNPLSSVVFAMFPSTISTWIICLSQHLLFPDPLAVPSKSCFFLFIWSKTSCCADSQKRCDFCHSLEKLNARQI